MIRVHKGKPAHTFLCPGHRSRVFFPVIAISIIAIAPSLRGDVNCFQDIVFIVSIFFFEIAFNSSRHNDMKRRQKYNILLFLMIV